MEYFGFFIFGLFCGAAIVYFINRLNKKDVEKTFTALSFDALTKNSQEFLRLANESLSKQTQAGTGELESKKQLIEKTVEGMKTDLKKVEELVTTFEKDRDKKYGELTNQLKTTAETTSKLQDVTSKLQTALASTRIRGQWGERMAEDVLRLAGFIEGINYVKQKTLDLAMSRPDYTFLLPQDLKVNMDVKFPLDNYMKYVDEESESSKQGYREQFLKDVRQRVKEVTTRDYINPEENTVDYVLVFIPNEQVYCFVNECDRALIDDAMRNKVILCSPLTLYAILAVMRQAIDNFNLEKTASEILGLLGTFNKQWGAFKGSMERMGKRIEDAREEYIKLVSTRSNQLDRPLTKINNLRRQRGILEVPLEEGPLMIEEQEESTGSPEIEEPQ